MKRLRWLPLLIFAALAFSAVSVASVLAAGPPALPEKKRTNTGTGKETIYETLTGLKIKCTAATETGEEEGGGSIHGTFHIDFSGCTTVSGGLTVKCTGLGDATTGLVLALGQFWVEYDSLAPLNVAVVFRNETVHFTCAGLVLVEVKAGGETGCLFVNASEKLVTHEFNCKQTTGEPEVTEVWNNKGEKRALTGLLQSVNGGAAEMAAELALGATVTTTEATEIML